MSSDFRNSSDQGIFEFACSLLAREKYLDSVLEFEALSEQYPDEFKVVFMLGGAHYEADGFIDASIYLRKAVTMRPNHELASLLLFFSLRHGGLHNEAQAEMDRFLSVAPSEQYSTIKRELAEADVEA